MLHLGAILATWSTFRTFTIPTTGPGVSPPTYLQAAPASIQIAGLWFLPESPRFLIANGKPEQAKAFLFKYHGNGDIKSQLADLEYREMCAVIEAEMANNTGWRFLLKTPGKRRRILVPVLLGLFSQWSGNGLISYHLVRVLETAGMTNKRHVNIINGCLMIFN
ncbi:Lactose permease like protein [Verticillium longisporum]|nr:Lactose permease like protein [Verticillium longisporum]KAG7139312.1 Lactose permease like protein [Verticillium longisporum]